MKKLILLLFIPLFSFSQTYEEVISISNLDFFRKVMIENDYKRHYENEDKGTVYSYGKGIEKDSLSSGFVAYRWGYYDTETNEWEIKIHDRSILWDAYEKIYNEVKENCEFYEVLTRNDSVEAVTYFCKDSSLKGKIGFFTDEKDSGNIVFFPDSN